MSYPARRFGANPIPAEKALEREGWYFVPVPFYIPAPALLIAALLIRARRYGGAAVAALVSLLATIPPLLEIASPLPGIAWSYATPTFVFIAAVVGAYRQLPRPTAEPADLPDTA